MTPHPLPHRILVRQDPPETVINGILVPEGSEKYSSIVTVIAVGSGLEHLELKPGSRVFITRQANSALIPDRRVLAETLGLPEEFKDLLMLKEDAIQFEVTNEDLPGLYPTDSDAA